MSHSAGTDQIINQSSFKGGWSEAGDSRRDTEDYCHVGLLGLFERGPSRGPGRSNQLIPRAGAPFAVRPSKAHIEEKHGKDRDSLKFRLKRPAGRPGC